MPNVIITPAFAGIRARAEQNKYNALASGVEGASNIVAQALLTYSQRKQEEDNAKFHLLDATIQRYGERADQPLLSEYDKVLRRKGGFGLPKDDQGRLKPFPPQNELQLLREQMGSGTPEAQEATANWIAKKTTGKSIVEQHLIEAHEAEVKRYHDLANDARMISAQAAMIRARQAQLQGRKATEASGLIRDNDGKLIDDQGQDLEPGQIRLSVAQAKADYNKRQIEQLGTMRSINNDLKRQDFKVKELTFSNMFLYGSARGLLPLIDMKAKGVLPNNMNPILDKGIKKILADNGITEPKEQQMWLAKIVQGWLGMPEQVKQEALAGVSEETPDLGQVPLKPGSRPMPGVVYHGAE